MNFADKKIAFYIRGRTIRTIAKQQEAIAQFAKEHGIPKEKTEIFLEHCDSDEVRPELFRLIENAERFDVVVMYSYHVLHIDIEKYKLLENSFLVNGLKPFFIHG
jgi:DNA invertase Pin-like site-specific DNA recombinase